MTTSVYPETDVEFDASDELNIALTPDAADATIAVGNKTVAATGTAEALVASETKVWRVDILALEANTGNVFIGDSSVDATTVPANPMAAGDSYSIVCPPGCQIDLNTIYVDAAVNGEGVGFTYFTVA